MRWQRKTPELYQGLAHPGRPRLQRALPLPGRQSGYAQGLRGSCFLFLTREFRLAAVSLAHPEVNETWTSIAASAPQHLAPALAYLFEQTRSGIASLKWDEANLGADFLQKSALLFVERF
jgi:hypothetical protein